MIKKWIEELSTIPLTYKMREQMMPIFADHKTTTLKFEQIGEMVKKYNWDASENFNRFKEVFTNIHNCLNFKIYTITTDAYFRNKEFIVFIVDLDKKYIYI